LGAIDTLEGRLQHRLMLPPTETVDSSSRFKDRKAGLVIFGILTVLMGVVCALMVPLMLWSQVMATKQGGPMGAHTILPAAMMYGGMAVVFIWLGIGSVMARRWARALLLILAWTWLVIGVVALGIMAFVLPKAMENVALAQPAGQQQPPLATSPVFMWIMMMVLTFIYVVVPGAWVLFYRSKHVKATCEARDPAPCWTDRSPLPVIAACLWLAFTCATMVLMAAAFKGVVPIFGTFVAGPLGAALYILVALLFGYSVWALYKLRWSAWWIVVVTMSLFSVSAFITYSRHDISELYILMGYSEQELAMIRQFTFLKGNTMAWYSLGGMAPFLGYMLYLRRFFPRETS
jgi:hypothetical protein